MITTEADMQAQIDALRADIQNLRTKLTTGVGLPEPGSAGQALLTDSALPYWATLPTPVTVVNVSAPLASTGGPTPTLSIPVATASVNGYLSSGDWSAFNAKVTSVGASGELSSSGGPTPVITHNTSGATANTYNFPSQIIVNASGHITGITDGASAISGAFNTKANLAGGNNFSGTQTVTGTVSATNVTVTTTFSLPGTTGQYVRGDGSRATFPTVGSGSVTSVNASGGSTGLSFSGGPITGSGTLTLSGTLAIANGGTGASSSGSALTALGAMPKAGGTFTGAITAPGVTDSSDIRFKRELVALHDGIDILRALKPMRFFNTLTECHEVGFVAQDLREVLPEVVSTDDNGDLAVAYQRIIAPVVSALQNIDARLRVMEGRA